MNDRLKISFSFDAPDDYTLDELQVFCDAVSEEINKHRGIRFGQRMRRITTTVGETVDVDFDV